MIRFIDLTKDYFALGPPFSPICAFLSTVNNRFIQNDGSSHTFSDMDDIDSIEPDTIRDRCKGLLPKGFFEQTEEEMNLKYGDK